MSPSPASKRRSKRAANALRLGALALLWLGCGTLEAPPLESRTDPGKGPFRDQGPLEVCLGKTRLVSRKKGGAPLVGLCVEQGASERACSDDSSCQRGESCVCGRCILEGCSSAQPCSGGRLCRDGRCAEACLDDGACAPGEVCSSGGCTRKCSDDAECGYGGSCDSLLGTCVAEACSADAMCGIGRVCALEERAADVREPAFADLSSGLSLYVEVREVDGKDERRSIYRGSLEAGSRLVLDDPPVIGPDPGAGAPAPLVRSGSIEALFAELPDGSIGRFAAASPDGRSFSQPAQVVLTAQAPWQQGRVGSPSVVAFSGRDVLLFEGGSRAGVGLCTLAPGGGVSSCLPDPIVTPASASDPLLWRELTEVGSPSAVVHDDVLLVYFTGRGGEGSSALSGEGELPAPRNDSVGLLASRDLARFDLAPQGPVFARRTNLRTYLGEREPSVRLLPDGATLVYVASDAAGAVAGLAIASSP